MFENVFFKLNIGEQNAKRRKLMVNSDDDDRDSSDSEKAERRLRQSSKQKRLDSSEEDDKNFVCADLIVLGLPFKLEEFELKEYFEHFGAVSRFEVFFKDFFGMYYFVNGQSVN